MTRETYEKHSIQELKEMFSLPHDAFIDRVSEVILPEEVNIRRGIASPNDKIGLPGSGTQYEIVGNRIKQVEGKMGK